jgi:hypothetical protein
MRTLLLMLVAVGARAQTGSIEGMVVNSVTGDVVPRAAVLVIEEGREPEPVFSDGEGRFRMEGLAARIYVVRARKRGYLEAGQGGESALRVTVEAGKAKGGVVVKLRPYGVISGRVFDEYGEPAEGATVNACVLRRRMMHCVGAAETNDRGEYRMTGLAPGAYLLVGTYAPPRGLYPAAANGRREAYTPTFYPQGVERASGQKVEVAAGAETAGIDLRMLKVAMATVRGRVVGADGEGLKSYGLRVDGAEVSMGTIVPTRLGSDGTFEVRDLAPGAWGLTVTTPDTSVSATVTVNGQDVEGVLIRLSAVVPVSGQVAVEGGAAVDWEQRKLWLAEVDWALSRTAKMARDGSFRVSVPPGRYRVIGDGPPGAYLASVRAGATESRVLEVDLTSGAPASLKVIYRMDGGRVRCAVEAGETVREINMVLLPAEAALRRPGMIRVEGLGTGTEAEFTAVRPGEYLVAAVEAGDYELLSDGEIPQAALDAAVKLKVDARGSHHVVLKPVKGR